MRPCRCCFSGKRPRTFWSSRMPGRVWTRGDAEAVLQVHEYAEASDDVGRALDHSSDVLWNDYLHGLNWPVEGAFADEFDGAQEDQADFLEQYSPRSVTLWPEWPEEGLRIA